MPREGSSDTARISTHDFRVRLLASGVRYDSPPRFMTPGRRHRAVSRDAPARSSGRRAAAGGAPRCCRWVTERAGRRARVRGGGAGVAWQGVRQVGAWRPAMRPDHPTMRHGAGPARRGAGPPPLGASRAVQGGARGAPIETGASPGCVAAPPPCRAGDPGTWVQAPDARRWARPGAPRGRRLPRDWEGALAGARALGRRAGEVLVGQGQARGVPRGTEAPTGCLGDGCVPA